MIIEDGEEPGQAGWINSRKFLEQEGVMRFCDGCGEPPRKTDKGIHIPMKRCSNCHHAWYHDRDCQKHHFQTHKKDCRLWAKQIKNEPRLEAYPFVEYHQNETAAEDAKLYDRCRQNWDQSSETWDQNRPEILNGIFYQHFFLPTCFQGDVDKKVDIILDFGCATGQLSNLMRRHATRVIALDISPKMIEKVRANRWENVEAVAGCLVDLEDPNIRQLRETYRNKVDLIVSTTVLPYVPPLQTKATFLAFRDLLKPGTGRFCHVDFDKDSPSNKFPNYITHKECETFYKWGQLQQEMLKTETIEVEGVAGTIPITQVFGVAKK